MSERPGHDEGAPGVGFHGKLICLCEHNRTYCPHTEGTCPWWDREPIAATLADVLRRDEEQG